MRRAIAAFWAAAMLCGCRAESPPEAGEGQAQGEAWLSPERVAQSGISVAAVEEHAISNAIAASGRVSFDDSRVTHVFSPVNGRILKVLVQPGQWVEKGQPLLLLASPDIGQAFSDLVKARADATAAAAELQRQHELFESHAGARRDLETAQDNAAKADAELKRAQQRIALLAPGSQEQVTQDYELRAPIAGEVVARNANPGIEVQGQYSGSTAVELFTIGELDRVWVFADVYEVDLPKVQKEAVVTVKVISYPDKAFQGRVEWISGALDPVSHTARIRCALENPLKELKPEMYATVYIALDETRAVAVPRSSVLRLGDRTVVFIEKGRNAKGLMVFQPRNVTVRDGGGDYVPILDGLQKGDRVVTAGAIFLSGLL